MKLVKKAINSARRAKIRNRGQAERGLIANTFASFFDSLPRTPPGTGGDAAFRDAFFQSLTVLEIEDVFSSNKDAEPVEGRLATKLLSGAGETIAAQIPQNHQGQFCLWLDTKTSLELETSDFLLPSNCVALSLSLPDLKPRRRSLPGLAVFEALLAAGFEPILRSEATEDGSFNVLFIRTSLIEAQTTELGKIIDTATDPEGQLLPNLNRDIPVFIPCFNNQTYCTNMVNQLTARGFENVTLIDNASTNKDMHRFLDDIENVVNVERLTENLGPKKSVFTEERLKDIPRYFCVTDPDIVFNPFLPDDFIAQLIDQTRIHKSGKAGFALNIAHRQFFKEVTFNLLYQDWSICEWEERFWRNPVARTRSNDVVYKTTIDTTFAVYDKEQWVWSDFHNAVRVGGRFTSIHAPWYTASDVPQSEREAYQREGKYSYYKM